ARPRAVRTMPAGEVRTWDERRTMLRRLGALGAAVAVLLVGLAPPSWAASVAVPGNANLGNTTIGGTLTAQPGSVTASAGGILGVQVTANVSCSDFKTGSGSSGGTI